MIRGGSTAALRRARAESAHVHARRRSLLAIDAALAVGLTALLALAFAAAYRQFAAARHHAEVREALRLAVDRELVRLRAAGPSAVAAAERESTGPAGAGRDGAAGDGAVRSSTGAAASSPAPQPGAPLEPAERVPGHITLTTAVRPGEGAWAGMLHVTVTASGYVYGNPASVALSAYLPREDEAPAGPLESDRQASRDGPSVERSRRPEQEP